MLVHEILLTLSGLPGQVFYFEKVEDEGRRCRLAIEVASQLHPAETRALEHLTELGVVYQRIRRILKKLPEGIYPAALAIGIRESLDEYAGHIVQVEEAVMSSNTEPFASIALLETHFASVWQITCFKLTIPHTGGCRTGVDC